MTVGHIAVPPEDNIADFVTQITGGEEMGTNLAKMLLNFSLESEYKKDLMQQLFVHFWEDLWAEAGHENKFDRKVERHTIDTFLMKINESSASHKEAIVPIICKTDNKINVSSKVITRGRVGVPVPSEKVFGPFLDGQVFQCPLSPKKYACNFLHTCNIRSIDAHLRVVCKHFSDWHPVSQLPYGYENLGASQSKSMFDDLLGHQTNFPWNTIVASLPVHFPTEWLNKKYKTDHHLQQVYIQRRISKSDLYRMAKL